MRSPSLLDGVTNGNFTKPTVYDYAHKCATELDGNYSFKIPRNNQFYVKNDVTPNQLWFNFDIFTKSLGTPGWFQLQ